MSSLLEEYNRGDYEGAWDRMQQLGTNIRDELYLEECFAVARETMRRVRYNIEFLLHNLPKLGYQFGFFSHESTSDISLLLNDDAFWIGIPDEAREEVRIAMQSASTADVSSWKLNKPPLWELPTSNINAVLQDFEAAFGTFPLSLYAWYEMIGSVNFVGKLPKRWEEDLQNPNNLKLHKITDNFDPLYIHPLSKILDEKRFRKNHFGTWDIFLCPEELFKAEPNDGDGYYVQIPSPTSDCYFYGNWGFKYFVDYLRESFQSCGLRGLSSYPIPSHDLKSIADNLLPF